MFSSTIAARIVLGRREPLPATREGDLPLLEVFGECLANCPHHSCTVTEVPKHLLPIGMLVNGPSLFSLSHFKFPYSSGYRLCPI